MGAVTAGLGRWTMRKVSTEQWDILLALGSGKGECCTMSCVSSMLMSLLDTESRVELTGLDDTLGKILSSLDLINLVNRTPAHVHGYPLGFARPPRI